MASPTVKAVKIGHTDVGQEDHPDVEVWVVNHQVITQGWDGKTPLWEAEGSDQLRGILSAHNIPFSEQDDDDDDSDPPGRFKSGRPVLSASVDVPTCNHRGIQVYRVVHGGNRLKNVNPTPHAGLKSRGHGYATWSANPLNFQLLFQKHLHWGWRGRSVFLSTTSCVRKAIRMMAIYHVDGMQDIKLYKIDTSAAAAAAAATATATATTNGRESSSPIFSVREVAAVLGFPCKKYSEDEYLFQDEIPEDAVVETLGVEDFMMTTAAGTGTGSSSSSSSSSSSVDPILKECFEKEVRRREKEKERKSATRGPSRSRRESTLGSGASGL